jgi:glycogen debranching enzyme
VSRRTFPQPQPDGAYVVGADGLAVGSTLGGPTLTVKLLATGAVENVHSTRSGRDLVRGFDVHHWDARTRVRLSRGQGSFQLKTYCQIHRYVLADTVHVEKTTFVLAGEPREGAPPEACYVLFCIRNEGHRAVELASVAVARLKLSFAEQIDARFSSRASGLAVWDCGVGAARAILASEAPHSCAVTADHARVAGRRWSGAFEPNVDTGGLDPLGVLHLQTKLEPDATYTFWLALLELVEGEASIDAVAGALPSARDALESTRRYYGSMLASTEMLSPVVEADRGVYWAKANMLRVLRETPTGRGFTNDPGRSNNCVGRDSFWFVHGCDWLDPSFSRALLRGFAHRQEDDGKIVEYYDLRTGKTCDDGLNVNDNTPLFVLAVWHHALATGDSGVLEEFYEAARCAVEQLLANRDERGLIWCNADGTGAHGIVGWRNVIKHYRISGATTELNSETFAALEKIAELAKMLGRDGDARRYEREAKALREAIEKHLRNPENGLYYLNIDVDGRPRTEVTSDLVFPVIFGVADEETSVRIIERLRAADFWTAAGVRTVPRDAPEYGPTQGSGLLGGVWAGVTFWYAFAASRFIPDLVLEALRQTFAHYARDPKATNTVPGQFSEWLNGETLVNGGMTLSPWFPPRYLWAAIEGACGLTPTPAGARIDPKLPPDWLWLGARSVPLRGKPISWFVVHQDGRQRLFATRAVETDAPLEIYETDVTDGVFVEGEGVATIAFARGDGTALLLANRAEHTITVAVRREGALHGHTVRRVFESLNGGWREDLRGEDDAFATAIAPGHYALVELSQNH